MLMRTREGRFWDSMDRFRRVWRLGRELISLYIYKKDLHFLNTT